MEHGSGGGRYTEATISRCKQVKPQTGSKMPGPGIDRRVCWHSPGLWQDLGWRRKPRAQLDPKSWLNKVGEGRPTQRTDASKNRTFYKKKQLFRSWTGTRGKATDPTSQPQMHMEMGSGGKWGSAWDSLSAHHLGWGMARPEADQEETPERAWQLCYSNSCGGESTPCWATQRKHQGQSRGRGEGELWAVPLPWFPCKGIGEAG